MILRDLRLLYRTGQLTEDCLKRSRAVLIERVCKPIFRLGQIGEVSFAGVKERLEEDFVESAAACEFFMACAEEFETEWGCRLEFSEKLAREESMRAGNGHEDE